MIWITADDVLALHERVIAASGGSAGLRDRGALEAAVSAPLQSFGGQALYPTAPTRIARLGYGLCANHPFVDGNKRIAALLVQLLLQWNNFPLTLPEGALSEMFLALAAGEAGEAELLRWIFAHLRG